MDDAQRIEVARANGINQPELVMSAARATGIPFYIGCAYLIQETSGGQMIFGSDPTQFRGSELVQTDKGRLVTKDRYQCYKAQRNRLGAQGVGPLQATDPGWQDEVDAAGGCWDFETNVFKGFELLMRFKATRTWDEVALRWNGGQTFVEHNRELRTQWKALMSDT